MGRKRKFIQLFYSFTAVYFRSIIHRMRVVARTGVYQYSIARCEKVMDMGMVLAPNSIGIGTAINFQLTGEGKAAITGDFALLDSEVNPVIQALRDNGVEVITA